MREERVRFAFEMEDCKSAGFHPAGSAPPNRPSFLNEQSREAHPRYNRSLCRSGHRLSYLQKLDGLDSEITQSFTILLH
jgi:hypothetical protein